MTTSEARALPFFTDTLGSPLESGSIYIGQSGLDPIAYPVIVTSDIGGDVVVSQPIRTTHGHAVAAGSLIHLYCPVPYSITILDGAGRLVYSSLNETDAVAIAVATSSVQSAPNLASLRSRSGSSTNQVWVDGYGMYVYAPSDTTSPETVPTVIVGTDGSRYHLSQQYVNAGWVRASADAPVNNYGAWMHWNTVSGTAYLSNNIGGGTGGFVIRNLSADGATVLGSMTLDDSGNITSSGQINASTNVVAAGNVTAASGSLNLNSGGSRALQYNVAGSTYQLIGAPLLINGANAITSSTLSAAILANQQANGVGAVAVGNSTAPAPGGSVPGTWVQTGTNFGTVYLYVRTV